MNKLMIISICALSLFLYAHQAWATEEEPEPAENTQQTQDNLQAIQDNMEKIQKAIKKAYDQGNSIVKKVRNMPTIAIDSSHVVQKTNNMYQTALDNIETYSQTILEALQKIERTTTEKSETQEEQQDETPNSP